MKTTMRSLLGGFFLVMLICGCNKDDNEILTTEQGVSENTDTSAKSYNNGVIIAYDQDVVFQWNDMLAISVDNKIPPPAEARVYAMVTLAIHDALNNIIPKYETYALSNEGVNGKLVKRSQIQPYADAAVSQAAYEVLTSVFPPSQPAAEALLSDILAEIADEEFRDKGIALGKEVAQALLGKRQTDQPITFSTFDMGTDPGVHQVDYLPFVNATPGWPEKAVYGADLGSYMPFGMATTDQFRARPPYPVNSDEYAADFNEVKRLGCADCPDRTPEQSEIGLFWIENVSSLMNRIVLDLSRAKNLNAWEMARLSALMAISQIDANISSFEGKYFYNFWRPITAVHAADTDGNALTQADPGWVQNATFTPPTPDYPSTHAQTGGAGEELLRLYFGKDKTSLEVRSPYFMPGTTRHMESFSQIGEEIALSRIYIGFHFRNAVEQGRLNGNRLGKYVFENNLRELKP